MCSSASPCIHARHWGQCLVQQGTSVNACTISKQYLHDSWTQPYDMACTILFSLRIHLVTIHYTNSTSLITAAGPQPANEHHSLHSGQGIPMRKTLQMPDAFMQSMFDWWMVTGPSTTLMTVSSLRSRLGWNSSGDSVLSSSSPLLSKSVTFSALKYIAHTGFTVWHCFEWRASWLHFVPWQLVERHLLVASRQPVARG